MPLLLCWIGYFLLNENPDWFNGADTVAIVFLVGAIIGTAWTLFVLLMFLATFFGR